MNIKYLNNLTKLTKSEKNLEEWIEENPIVFLKTSLKDVLDILSLNSPSIVTKYVKKIGYKNLKEFKLSIKNKLKESPQKISESFSNPLLYLQSRYYLTINDIYKNIENNFLEKSYFLLKTAKKIYIYKNQEFNFSFSDFENYFKNRNKKIVYFDNYDLLLHNYDYENEIILFIDDFEKDIHFEFINALDKLEIKSIILSKNDFNFSSKFIAYYKLKNNNFKDLHFFQNNLKLSYIFLLDLLISIFEK
ncbi:MurR/RpiR family transcriptional regulator [Mesomycoplasma neurolyticum]|uniref:HTH rpiR-type domain-containing protein n=1 Tax=Mesomycoplasma neurolyticum TaxID=2120 RepID=A0A449A502_9BACT|nr:hypothetical protein [Mesomycoplasma neurolyticum]VEU59309.1 Uncharacterised protein [Mesomycoplasma neurolyticum]